MEHSAFVDGKKSEVDNQLSNEIINNASFYYRLLHRYIRERNRVCELFGTYFEDIAGIEDLYGKSLGKVRKRKNSSNHTSAPFVLSY